MKHYSKTDYIINEVLDWKRLLSISPSRSHQSPTPVSACSPVTTKCGRRGSVSSMPTFLQLCQLLYFLGTLLPHSLGTRLHRGIQYLLMDTVGGAIGFSIPVIPTAHIFHTALAVPAADHRNERIPTFSAGQQPRVTVLGLIAVCGPCLPLE